MITQNKLKELFFYDDGKFIWKFGSNRRGKVAGNLNKRYFRVGVNNKVYALHRLIFLYHHGYLPKMIDHIDGNCLNNRIENLRECTYSENNANSSARKNSKVGFKNISWHKGLKKYTVRITKDYKVYNLGVYDDLELAKLVALEARDKFHGRFARLY